ncbi:hypothetical protein [Methylobacterium sp. E-045]|uniref:hypothetical protein n=1 Tax=Methylobacterium sp. E-045 TaxID=2836575 RepID=UPI001FBA6E79|nr:hypothetical protein [Methylobacterium sp. E-045]MCJ2131725.1 hypothetical protein [Methylobacterium sp. E-045]
MIRPRTTGHLAETIQQPEAAAKPSSKESADLIGQALLSLVMVVESQPLVGPAVKAYQTAIRRNGEEASALGGQEAMEAALHFVIDADPAHAERRESIIDKAWTGLPGWRS